MAFMPPSNLIGGNLATPGPTPVEAEIAPNLLWKYSLAAADRSNIVVGDGDSITAADTDSVNNVLANSWYTYMCAFSNGRIPYLYNAGHGGFTSNQLLNLLPDEVISKVPGDNGFAIIAWGRNDSQTLALTIASDQAAAAQLLAAGITPVYTTLPPVGITALATPAAPIGVASASGGTLASATYTYKIVAKNNNGKTLPSTGTGVAVTGPTGSVALTWTYQQGTSGYEIYRNDQLIGSTSNPYSISFTDTGQAGGAAPPGANTTGLAASAADSLFTSKVNAWRKRWAAMNGFSVIDFYTLLADATTGRYKQGYTSDGTHPTPVAQKAMGSQAWAQMSERTVSAFGYVAVDNADPLNLYTNGLFLTGGTVPTGWPAITTGHSSTLNAATGFKGNAFAITRSDPAASAYLGLIVLSTGWSVGDTVQFSCIASSSGPETTGLVTEFGCFFVGTSPAKFVADWKLQADIATPTEFVSPEVVIPAGTTGLRLFAFTSGGTGTLTVGQYTIRNLTTGGTLTV